METLHTDGPLHDAVVVLVSVFLKFKLVISNTKKIDNANDFRSLNKQE